MVLTCHFIFSFRPWPEPATSLMSPNLASLKIAGYVYPLEFTHNCHLLLLQWPCQVILLHLSSAAPTLVLPGPHTFSLYLFFGMADCFKAFCRNTKLSRLLQNHNPWYLISVTVPYSPKYVNSLWFSLVYHHLPTRWSGVCMLVFFFPEFGVIHREEPLPIPVVDSIPYQHNKRSVQIIPLIAAVGITVSYCPS